jgi:hypothetical protein
MKKTNEFTPKDEAHPSWVELSRRLGFSRRAIYNWRDMADAPKEPDPVLWQAFIEDHGLGQRDTKSLTEIKSAVESEKLRKLRRENEVAEGKIVTVESVASFLGELAAKHDLLITQKLKNELPSRVVGLPIAEVRVACLAVQQEVREATSRDFASWSATP